MGNATKADGREVHLFHLSPTDFSRETMTTLLRLPNPSPAQRLWTQACQAVASRLEAVGADLGRAILAPLDESQSLEQISQAGPWAAAVVAKGMDVFAVQNRLARSRPDGTFVENSFVCLFREPPAELRETLLIFGESTASVAIAREFFVAHEAMHCWQEERRFDFPLSGLRAGSSPVEAETIQSIERFIHDPSLNPRPAPGEALEAALIFEEFCADVLACKLIESPEMPASKLLASTARRRSLRGPIEAGRYQHAGLLEKMAGSAIAPLNWAEFVLGLGAFCADNSAEFLAASKRGLASPDTKVKIQRCRGDASAVLDERTRPKES